MSFDAERETECWISRLDAPAGDLEFNFESLAWSGALASLAPRFSEPLWWKLFNTLVDLASRGLTTYGPPLLGQVLHGELALTLAYSFPELEACRALARPAGHTVSLALSELLDGEGLIHADHRAWLRPLLAAWTRCRALGNHLSESWCDESTARQYPLLVQHALRWSRTDGRQVFTSKDSATWDPDLLKHTIRLAGDKTTRQIARLTTVGTRSQRLRRAKDMPPPANESEWAATAVLRPDWLRAAPRLSVAYSGPQVEIELAIGKDCLWSGNWTIEVKRNGQPLEPVGQWSQVCWESDHDVDYLELEMRLHGDVIVERHVLLGRNDPFLFLADTVLSSQPARLEYRSVLPLAGLSTFQPESETREGVLVVGGRRKARVLPLALPEWRASPGRGSFEVTGESLELRQSADGRRLFAPLFIDLDARRSGRDVTWRQLTVAEDRRIVPSETAVGYRVQCGKSQWLVYRSLGRPAVRSVLGTNLMHEFMVADFKRDGSVHRLLEIESA